MSFLFDDSGNWPEGSEENKKKFYQSLSEVRKL